MGPCCTRKTKLPFHICTQVPVVPPLGIIANFQIFHHTFPYLHHPFDSCFLCVYLHMLSKVQSTVNHYSLFFFFFFFWWYWGLNSEPTPLSHSTSPFFCEGFFKLGSCELFAWADFEPLSSRSLLPE
jgi:hypothetical protein